MSIRVAAAAAVQLAGVAEADVSRGRVGGRGGGVVDGDGHCVTIVARGVVLCRCDGDLVDKDVSTGQRVGELPGDGDHADLTHP